MGNYISPQRRRFNKQLRRNSLIGVLALVGVVAAVVLAKQAQFLFTKAANQPANIQVDTQAVIGPLPRPWANYAQGGEDHAWRMAPLVNQMRPLRPEYIRLDHIFDFYDIVSGNSGNLSFDFSKLDPVLDDIKAVGATPYISISYNVPNLAVDGQVTGKPQNYADWQNMTRALVSHVSGKRGFVNVYYEVWNEPDLFGKWSYGGNKSYIDLYAAAVRGANAAGAVQPFKIGGPVTTALYKSWIQSLANFSQTTGTRLDFLSWHRYTRNLDDYRKDATQIREFLMPYPAVANRAEFHITEWGHNSELDAGYDGIVSATHTVAGAIEMMGVIQRAFVFEIQDGKSPEGKEYWGRWGLFTHDDFGSKPKPRYRGLLMLAKLGSERIQLMGKGSFVKAAASRRDDGSFQVILANYDPAGRNVENVPVTLTGLSPNTTYALTTSFLRRASQKTATSTNELGVLSAMVPMQALEVALLEVKP